MTIEPDAESVSMQPPVDMTDRAMRMLLSENRALRSQLRILKERLAGVEALADEFRRLDYSWDGQTGEPLIPLSHLLAALPPEVETSRQTPRNGPRSDDWAIGGVPGRSESGEAASEEKP